MFDRTVSLQIVKALHGHVLGCGDIAEIVMDCENVALACAKDKQLQEMLDNDLFQVTV